MVPGLSAHFASQDPDDPSKLIPVHNQPLYKHDWIGLKALDDTDGLKLAWCKGPHMDLGGPGGCGDQAVADWVGWPDE